MCLSNCAIAASRNGGPLMTASPRPRAFFGHEVAHGFTHPNGTTRNFLGEGWATYAESWLLEEAFGPEVVERFWESQREQYLGGSFDGRVGLARDDSNGGVSYCKGAWVLRMLEDEIGRTAFDAGMRSYMAIEPGAEADYPQFLSRMSAATGRDMGSFLDPWVRGTAVPRLEASIEGERVLVSQGPGSPSLPDEGRHPGRGRRRERGPDRPARCASCKHGAAAAARRTRCRGHDRSGP